MVSIDADFYSRIIFLILRIFYDLKLVFVC